MLALGALLFAACEAADPVPPDSTAPGRVTDLRVKSATTNVITLRWTTPGDNGTQGTATSYQVRWSPDIITEANFESANAINDPPIPAAPNTVELFAVPNMDITAVRHFALRTYDEAGFVSEVSNDALWTPGGLPVQFFTNIPALKDNTMFSEADNLSNGAGQYMFVGRTGSLPAATRRALLAFAITDSVPAGAVVDSVRLTLHMSDTPDDSLTTVRLHKALADWGQAGSNAPGNEESGVQAETGDATWGFRIFNTSAWPTPGGDFVATASAQGPVGVTGFYSWSATQMKSDVQSWLDAPVNNFGWVIVGNETAFETRKRFDTREHLTSAYRPTLRVYYTVNP